MNKIVEVKFFRKKKKYSKGNLIVKTIRILKNNLL